MTDPENPSLNTGLTLEDAERDHRRTRWAAVAAGLGGAAVGAGFGFLFGSVMDTGTAADYVVGVGVGVAFTAPFVIMGLEWCDASAARVETARGNDVVTG